MPLCPPVGRPLRWDPVDFATYNAHVRRHLGDHHATGLADLYGGAADLSAPARPTRPVERGRTTLEQWAAGRAWSAAPALGRR